MFKLIKFIIILSFLSINIMGDGFSKKSLGSSVIHCCWCSGNEGDPYGLGFKTADVDINGDGYKDIIGLQISNFGGYIELWILYGFSERFPEEFYICEAPISYTEICGIYACGFRYGFSTGDINGDGFDDIVIGHVFRSFTPKALETFVIYGSPNLPEKIDLRNPPSSVKISRIYTTDFYQRYSLLGVYIAIGDLNMDSYDDLIVSEPGDVDYNTNGKLYILYGSSSGIPDIDISNPPANTTIIEGKRPEDWFGWSFEIADCNGDKKNDLIMGFHWDGFNNDREGAGLIMILYNELSGFPEIIDPNNPPENSTIIYGAREYDGIWGGSRRILIKDVNNDGYEDLILDLYRATNISGRHGGYIWIYYGNSYGIPKTIDLLYLPENSTYIYNSAEKGGVGFFSFGNRDGDAFEDLLISGYFEEYDKLWLIYGPLDNLPKLIDLSNPPDNLKIVSYGEGQSGWDYWGAGAKLNDTNNDGIDEMIFSAGEGYTDYIFILYLSNYKFLEKTQK